MLLVRSSPRALLAKNRVWRPSACESCSFLTRTQLSVDESLICNHSIHIIYIIYAQVNDTRINFLEKWTIKTLFNRFNLVWNSSSFYDDGLSFISVTLRERSTLNLYHLTPCKPWAFPRYFPFRLEWWQFLYHQAPVQLTAQFCPPSLSLSRPFVVNAMLLRSWPPGPKESPAVPEYEPTSSRYFACSSPMLNVPYLAYTLTPFQSSSSTRKEQGLAAVSLWILSFPNQNSAVSWPKPDL